MQRELRLITLQGAIEKSPILLSQYWKNEWLDGTKIISYFCGSNDNFADCNSIQRKMYSKGFYIFSHLHNHVVHNQWKNGQPLSPSNSQVKPRSTHLIEYRKIP